MEELELAMMHLDRWHKRYNLTTPAVVLVYPNAQTMWDAKSRFSLEFRPNYYTAGRGTSIERVRFTFDYQQPKYEV